MSFHLVLFVSLFPFSLTFFGLIEFLFFPILKWPIIASKDGSTNSSVPPVSYRVTLPCSPPKGGKDFSRPFNLASLWIKRRWWTCPCASTGQSVHGPGSFRVLPLIPGSWNPAARTRETQVTSKNHVWLLLSTPAELWAGRRHHC